jgi:hypothetical protein
MYGAYICNNQHLLMHNLFHAVLRVSSGVTASADVLLTSCCCCCRVLLLLHVTLHVTQAVTFLKRVKEVVEDPRRLLLSV